MYHLFALEINFVIYLCLLHKSRVHITPHVKARPDYYVMFVVTFVHSTALKVLRTNLTVSWQVSVLIFIRQGGDSRWNLMCHVRFSACSAFMSKTQTMHLAPIGSLTNLGWVEHYHIKTTTWWTSRGTQVFHSRGVGSHWAGDTVMFFSSQVCTPSTPRAKNVTFIPKNILFFSPAPPHE